MADEGIGWVGMLGAMHRASMTMLRAAVKPVGWLYDQLRQPAMQGSAEAANVLFTGSAYVPYGEGQRAQEPPKAEAAKAPEPQLPEPPQPAKADQTQVKKGMRM